MKLIIGLGLAILALPFMGSIALANESLGDVIRDSIRDEIRDDIRALVIVPATQTEWPAFSVKSNRFGAGLSGNWFK